MTLSGLRVLGNSARAYGLKASNAALPISTFPGAIPQVVIAIVMLEDLDHR